MTVYVALLRAIGPGSHAIMRSAALRDKAEAAGFADPVNYLATGNLIFGSSKSVTTVRTEITTLVEDFGLRSSEVFIATRAQVARLVAADPLPEAARLRPRRLGVCFFHKAHNWPGGLLHPASGETVATLGSMVVIDYGPGDGPSRLNPERLTGATMTQRNWNTVLGIWQRMQDR